MEGGCTGARQPWLSGQVAEQRNGGSGGEGSSHSLVHDWVPDLLPWRWVRGDAPTVAAGRHLQVG